MKLILFTAMQQEAMPIISRLKNAKKIKAGNLKYWQGTFENNIHAEIFCTGIGVKTIDFPFDNNSIILNIGIAGALSKQFKIGDWLTISKINNVNCNIVNELKTATLFTVNKPIIKEAEAKKINADLVDMEGFHIFNFAKKNKLKCYIIKMVSDFANETSSTDYKISMKVYNKTCFEKLLLFIKNI